MQGRLPRQGSGPNQMPLPSAIQAMDVTHRLCLGGTLPLVD